MVVSDKPKRPDIVALELWTGLLLYKQDILCEEALGYIVLAMVLYICMKKPVYMKKALLPLVVFFAAILLAILAMNAPYVWTRVKYAASTPDPKAVLKSISITEQADSTKGYWQPNTLAIPSLGVVAPIQYGTKRSEDAFQELLREGVVHYPGTAMPGAVGNMFIFGHSSDYAWSKGNYKTVLALLPKLEKGSEIKVVDADGYIYTYIAKEFHVVAPTEVQWLSQDTGGKKLLTVQTSYPIGTALKRYLVIAELRQSD